MQAHSEQVKAAFEDFKEQLRAVQAAVASGADLQVIEGKLAECVAQFDELEAMAKVSLLMMGK